MATIADSTQLFGAEDPLTTDFASRIGLDLDDDDDRGHMRADDAPFHAAQQRPVVSDFDAAELVADIQRQRVSPDNNPAAVAPPRHPLGGSPPQPAAMSALAPGAQLQGGAFEALAEMGGTFTANVDAAPFVPSSASGATPPRAGQPAKPGPSLRRQEGTVTAVTEMPPDIGSLECTVYVQYLPVAMREIEFMELICTYGEPKRVRICGNPKKEHNWTYGFVEYGTPGEAKRFIDHCDGIRAGSFRMRCNIAKTPIVDRLAIDAPPDGKCTFAQKFPNRTLRELILASIAIADDDEHSRPQPARGAGSTTVASLAVPSDLVSPLMKIVKDALQFATDRNQSLYFQSKASLSFILDNAKRKSESAMSQRQLAALLNGTDVMFWCRMLLTVLNVLHGSHEEALRSALHAQQMMPTTLDVLNYINRLDSFDYSGAPRGFTPLLLNHLITFGLVLEPVSIVAARSFYHTAQHRAKVHGINVHKAIDSVLASDAVPPVTTVAQTPVEGQQPSLLRALLPSTSTFEGGFPAWFLAQLAKNSSPFSTSCVGLFHYQAAAAEAEASRTW